MTGKGGKAKALLREHWGALLLLALLLAVRLAGLLSLGARYSLSSDDMSYIKSGIHFAETGIISIHDEYPSAQIMPGMTVLIGLLYRMVGRGTPFWILMKLLWISTGTLTAWFVYRSVCLFAPKWCGLLAMLPLCRADFIWMDNLILTETPFMLALTALVYYTLRMEKEPGWQWFWGAAAAYMAALMLKANIALYPLFALVYLIARGYDRKLLLKQCVSLAGIVLCFVIPWSMRNYVQFHAFIPLTYGAGNPTLLGTYQGVGFPPDEQLDYDTNVEQVVKEKYAAYYQENGEVEPRYERYIARRADSVKAAYRQRVWAETNWKSMIYSYLFLKPKMMMESPFYWDTVLGVGAQQVNRLHTLDAYLCIMAFAAALIFRKLRAPFLFVAGVYLANIYIYAMTYAFSRYNASLMSLRFILIGLGTGAAIEFASSLAAKRRDAHGNP